jgi:hypothetical protein
MPKTLKTFALHERLSRAGKVFHGGQRKTSAWSWLHGKTSASGSLSMQLEAKKLKKYFKATPWFRFLSLVSVFVCFAY